MANERGTTAKVIRFALVVACAGHSWSCQSDEGFAPAASKREQVSPDRSIRVTAFDGSVSWYRRGGLPTARLDLASLYEKHFTSSHRMRPPRVELLGWSANGRWLWGKLRGIQRSTIAYFVVDGSTIEEQLFELPPHRRTHDILCRETGHLAYHGYTRETHDERNYRMPYHGPRTAMGEIPGTTPPKEYLGVFVHDLWTGTTQELELQIPGVTQAWPQQWQTESLLEVSVETSTGEVQRVSVRDPLPISAPLPTNER